MSELEVVYEAPAIPSKWDIIPIHASDVSAFLRCRRYWDWSSPTRTNLRRKVMIHGISFPLWYGSGIHYALERMYNPMLREDPVAAFLTWYTYQWEGGEVPNWFLEYSYDNNPVKLTEDTSRIEGLRDLLPNPHMLEFDEHRELGIGMMTYYRDVYAPKFDDFDVIAAESTFSVPLGFEWVDRREDSPNYGKKLEVHARGKRDLIKRDRETGQYGIKDYKTKAKIDDAYFASLVKDPQVTMYIWASQQEALIHDLPYKEISHVTHQAMRKVYPKPPSELKNGTPSVNRQEESTTAEMYKEFIVERGLEEWHRNNPKSENYYTWLLEKGHENFIIRTLVPRNQHEIAAQGEFVKLIAKEMLDSPAIYPHPTGDFLCVNCAFRTPCIATDDGSDAQFLIDDGYEHNLDR